MVRIQALDDEACWLERATGATMRIPSLDVRAVAPEGTISTVSDLTVRAAASATGRIVYCGRRVTGRPSLALWFAAWPGVSMQMKVHRKVCSTLFPSSSRHAVGIKGEPDKTSAHHPCRRPYGFASRTRPQIATAGHMCTTASQCCILRKRSCRDRGRPDHSVVRGRKAAVWVGSAVSHKHTSEQNTAADLAQYTVRARNSPS